MRRNELRVGTSLATESGIPAAREARTMTRTQGWVPSRTEMETSAIFQAHTPKRFPRMTFAQRTAFTDGWCNAILTMHRIVAAELAPRVERDSKAAW